MQYGHKERTEKEYTFLIFFLVTNEELISFKLASNLQQNGCLKWIEKHTT